MRIIGIDPGTGILGFGVIEVNAGKIKMIDAGASKITVDSGLIEYDYILPAITK